VIVESFESQKKLQDDARAREEDNDAWWHRAVDLSLQQAPGQRRKGGDDAAEWRVLVTHRRKRRQGVNENRRRGGDDGAGLTNVPPGSQ
jgi:hypothetical protein